MHMFSRTDFVLLLGVGLSICETATSFPSTQTTSCRIHGKHASGTTNQVEEYLGIPYAQPPIKQLRWAPPVKYNGTGILDATKFGYTCPANATFASRGELVARSKELSLTPQAIPILENLLEQPGVQYSEDCLTLNIWTKRAANGTLKPVLFWIYGGGFNTGTTNNPAYNGKYIVDREDVIIVSANYRLNIFGFPGDPNIQNNLGLLDQRLAIEWVHDNIASFGGDPDRITIFGQSAGGESVDFYAYAWTSDPIVAGFISESGTVYTPGAQTDQATSASRWYNVTSTLGCGNATSNPDKLLACMRSKDWRDIHDAIPVSTGIASATGQFGPTIDNITVFSDYVARSAAGAFIKRPLFLGSNNYEVGLFRPVFGAQNVTFTEAQWDYLNLAIYTCPASYRAEASVSNHVPTWRYRYFGEFPNLRLTNSPDSGAWHGSEVPLIFDTDKDLESLVARTEEETQIANYLRKAWVAFATDPENGLNKYGFPQYNSQKSTLLQLGYNNQTGPQTALPSTHDTGCVLGTTTVRLLLTLASLG
uniref:Carboxylic ester hydrolase n=2 Tax=Talaromyces marneffei TaxID=37727 RepID=A0A093UYT6_TALMA